MLEAGVEDSKIQQRCPMPVLPNPADAPPPVAAPSVEALQLRVTKLEDALRGAVALLQEQLPQAQRQAQLSAFEAAQRAARERFSAAACVSADEPELLSTPCVESSVGHLIF